MHETTDVHRDKCFLCLMSLSISALNQIFPALSHKLSCFFSTPDSRHVSFLADLKPSHLILFYILIPYALNNINIKSKTNVIKNVNVAESLTSLKI